MRTRCRVHINQQGFTAQRGEILLDAALGNGVDVPHDCRAGQCGTCKVKVVNGTTIGGECEPGVVKACQARVITDLEVVVEPVPGVLTTRGTVIATRQLAPDVVEVGIRPHDDIVYLPGQYYKFQFRGFPGRYFSPTAPMDRPAGGSSTIRLHVRRIEGGRVTPAIGHEIRPGHPVTLEGPFGSAYFRPGLRNRLILVGSGTGFAPIWSIADAAMAENPWREMVLMAAAKTMPSLYMAPAFRRLRDYPNVQLIPTVSEKPANVARVVRQGRPTQYMPALTPDDIVYACGAPQLVDAVRDMALAAGATFYADPFTPQHGGDDDESIVARAMTWLGAVVPIPGRGGEEPIRMLPKPQAPARQAPPRQEPRERALRPQQQRYGQPQPMRAARAQQAPGPARPRPPRSPYDWTSATGIPAE